MTKVWQRATFSMSLVLVKALTRWQRQAIRISQCLSRATTRSTRWKLFVPAPLDSAPPMARPTIQLPAKRKRGQLIGRAKKCAKWGNKKEVTRKRWQKRGNKEEATRRNLSQYGFRARSWQEAEDLSPWCRECWGACSGSLTIGSLTPKELHNILFWPSPSSSKSLII